jgi:O-antigen/teichoic acid export membrane protein
MTSPAGELTASGVRVARRQSLWQRVPAGLLDSACSSLATFIIGLLAVHALAAQALGAYSLAFTAFLFISTVPAALAFIPAEAAAISITEGGDRLGVLRRSLPGGLVIAVLSALVGTAVMIAIPTDAGLSARVSTGLGLLLLGSVSPVQDHLRRMLHAAEHSWSAAAVSLTQLVAVAVGVGVVLLADLGGKVWMPFTLLGCANLLSTIVGLVFASRRVTDPTLFRHFQLHGVMRTGRWLLSSQFAGSALGFVLVAIISTFSGSSAAGFAEAARVLCQPPTVIVTGLLSVIGPEIQSAMAAGRPRRLHALQWRFAIPVTLVTVVWGCLMVLPPFSTLLHHYFVRAYAVPGLLLIFLLGQVLAYSNNVLAGPFLVSGHARRLATTAYLAMATALTIVLVWRTHGALALAWATAAGELLQLTVLLWRQRRLLGQTGAVAGAGSPPP